MTFIRTVVAAALAVLPAHQAFVGASAQTPATLVAGQVIDAASGRPVSESVVTLSLASGSGSAVTPGGPGTAAQRKVLTDGSGRFAFQGLPAGRYNLSATRPGFVTGILGRLTPRGPGLPLQLREGERAIDLRILVWRHAALRGRVTDESGEAVAGARVNVLRRSMVAGRLSYTDAGTATTDDRGDYRVGALEPGSYVIGVLATFTSVPLDILDDFNAASGERRTELERPLFAAAPTMTTSTTAGRQVVGDHMLQLQGRLVTPPDPSRDGALQMYPSAFHGGASQIANAQVVVVAAGEQRAGADVSLRLTRVFRVSGTLATTEGPARPTALQIWPAAIHEANPSLPLASTVSDASGRFTFVAVPPGQYLLRAIDDPPARITGPQTAPTLWVSELVNVGDRDVASVRLLMQRGFRVSGRVLVEGDPLPVPVNRLFVNLESSDRTLFGEFSEVPVAPDGTFISVEAPSARYRLTLPLPSGWIVQSITSQGRPIEDLPFELKESLADLVITVSNRGSQITGTVRTAAGAPDATAGVLVFPADPRQWVDFSAYARGIRDVRTARDGAYTLANLPAGDYFVVATAQEQLDWTQPRFFETLSRLATRVTLGAGSTRALDLRRVAVKW